MTSEKKEAIATVAPVERPRCPLPGTRLEDFLSQDMLFRLPAIRVTNGATDYIDTLTREVCLDPLSCFVDDFRRPGIALRVQVLLNGAVVNEGLYAIFQRYTESDMLVCCRSHYGEGFERGDMNQEFASILTAHTALNERSYQVLRGIFSDYSHGRDYDAGDGLTVHLF
jgi:hypothetical protein